MRAISRVELGKYSVLYFVAVECPWTLQSEVKCYKYIIKTRQAIVEQLILQHSDV